MGNVILLDPRGELAGEVIVDNFSSFSAPITDRGAADLEPAGDKLNPLDAISRLDLPEVFAEYTLTYPDVRVSSILAHELAVSKTDPNGTDHRLWTGRFRSVASEIYAVLPEAGKELFDEDLLAWADQAKIKAEAAARMLKQHDDTKGNIQLMVPESKSDSEEELAIQLRKLGLPAFLAGKNMGVSGSLTVINRLERGVREGCEKIEDWKKLFEDVIVRAQFQLRGGERSRFMNELAVWGDERSFQSGVCVSFVNERGRVEEENKLGRVVAGPARIVMHKLSV